MRTITPEKANRAYDILVQCAGAADDLRERQAFVHHVAHPYDPAMEYRFGGRLGLGGKFRNDGSMGGLPYVNCYLEHLDPETRPVIEETNARLAALFTTGGEAMLFKAPAPRVSQAG